MTQGIKVLHVCESCAAGVGRHTIDLVEGLTAAGSEVHLAYSSTRLDSQFREGLSRIPADRCVEVNTIRSPEIRDFRALTRLLQYMRRSGPFDLIHGHSSKGGALSRLMSLVTRVPVVYTPHCISTMSPAWGNLSRRAFGMIELGLAQLTEEIIVVSEEELEHIVELGVPRHKLHLVRNGLKLPPIGSRSEVRHRLAIPQDAIVIGFVGRLSVQKNPQRAIRAFAEIALTRPKVRLAIVGTGELEQECRALSAELGVEDRIDWLGYVSGVDVMPAFDLILMSSQYEGLSYVMLEGIAVGLPIVTTAVGGATTFIEHGVNGLIVDQGTGSELVAALAQVCDSASVREQMARASLEHSKRFTIDRMISTTLDVYKAALQP